jgi:hypothetical protein
MNLQEQNKKKWWLIGIAILVALAIIFKDDKKPISGGRLLYDTYSCCNCFGTGKVTLLNITRNCRMCLGNGTLTQNSYNSNCK